MPWQGMVHCSNKPSPKPSQPFLCPLLPCAFTCVLCSALRPVWEAASRAAIFLSRPKPFMRWLVSAFLINSSEQDSKFSNRQPLDCQSTTLTIVLQWLYASINMIYYDVWYSRSTTSSARRTFTVIAFPCSRAICDFISSNVTSVWRSHSKGSPWWNNMILVYCRQQWEHAHHA